MEPTSGSTGTVVAVWRYPVKSMQGEEVNGALLTDRGVPGDRSYAVLERATGHIASAKHPRKWGKLFACRAAFVEPPQPDLPLPPVWITLPDGAVLHSADPDIDERLSRSLGRAVALVTTGAAMPTREANRTSIEELDVQERIMVETMARAAPQGTFFDYAPLHLLTTATLDRLRALYPAGRFEARRFRPNLVVAPHHGEPDFVENAWIGRRMGVGPAALLSLIDPCPRCVVTTLAQGDLPRDLGILRMAAQANAVASATLAPGIVLPAVAGVYASVLEGGRIARGDSVHLA
ncbi:MAG: sulfurase [Chloroflexi bacterium]|nr:MAG: sulfurase [Chloroflexota bacterium]